VPIPRPSAVTEAGARLVYPASRLYPPEATVNGWSVVPFWPIDPVNVCVDCVANGLVVVEVEDEPEQALIPIITATTNAACLKPASERVCNSMAPPEIGTLLKRLPVVVLE
jgi:hypothetical protein